MSDIDRQFRQRRQQITSQAQQQRENVERQAREQRERVQQAAREARETLRRQKSELERQVQEAKGGIRTEKRREGRKRDLPITKPVDVQAEERIASVEGQEAEIKGKIKEAEKGVAEAEQKDIEAIATAETEAKTELAKAETQALTELEQARVEAEKAQAKFEAENVKLSTGEYVSRLEFDNLPGATQQKLKELGVEGYNSWLAEQQTSLKSYELEGGYDLASYLRDNPRADTSNLLAIGFTQGDIDSAVTQNKELDQFESDLRQSNPTLYQVYKEGGIDAYNTEVERLQGIVNQYAVRSEWVTPATYQKIQDLKKQYEAGQLGKKDYTASVDALRYVQGFDLPQALDDKVPTATLLSLGITQSQIDAVKEARQVLDQLKDYKTEATPFYFGKDITTKEGGVLTMTPSYDLPKFLRDNPQFNPQQLVTAGFDQKAVDAAVEYNNQPWVSETSGEMLFNAIRKAINEGSLKYDNANVKKAVLADPTKAFFTAEWQEYYKTHPTMQTLYMQAFTTPKTKPTPSLSLEAFTEAYLEVRSDSDLPEKTLRKLAEMEYTRLYGQGAVARSTGIQVTSYLFSPTRVLYPEVELKDISKLEWAVGAAQVGLLAVGGISAVAPKVFSNVIMRAAGLGIQTAATGIFVTETVKNWAAMSPVERGISLAIDIALIAPLAKSGASWLRAKLSPVKAATEALLAQERAFSRELRSILTKTYGDDFAKAYMAVDRAQADYIRALAEVKRIDGIKFRGRTIRVASLTPSELESLAKALDTPVSELKKLKTIKLSGTQVKTRAISTAQANAEDLANALRTKANDYVKITKSRAGFDSPTVADAMSRLPDEVVANARAAVEQITSPKVNIKTLRTALQKTRANLNVAEQAKLQADAQVKAVYDEWVSAGSPKTGELRTRLNEVRLAAEKTDKAWAEALTAYTRALSNLELATSKDIVELYTALLKARAKLASATSKGQRLKLQKRVDVLENKLAKMIKMADVEWGRGGRLTRGGRPGIFSPPTTTGGGASVSISTATMTQDAFLRELASRADVAGGTAVAVPVYTPWGNFGVVVANPRETPVIGKPIKEEPVLPDIVIVDPHLVVAAPPKPVTEPRVEPTEPKVKPKVWPAHPEIKPYVWPEPSPSPYHTGVYFIEPLAKTQTQAAEVNAQILRELKALTQSAIKAGTRAALAGKTGTGLKAAVKTELKQQIRNMTGLQPAMRTQLALQIEPLTELAVKTVTRLITPPRTKIKLTSPITVTLPDGSKHTLTPEEIAGVVGWKQGFIYRAIWPPYGENNVTHSRKPILGIPYYKGAESAYRSIIRRGGKLPPTIARDMGIMDVIIESSRYGKPRLIFKPDVEQKTRVTGKVVKRHKSNSRVAPEVGLGSMR